MSAHTPTPWRIDDDAACNVLEIWADSGKRQGILVAQVWDPEADVSSQTDQMWADAHRIVAAVNACEGIPTEALESGVVANLLDTLREIGAYTGEGPHTTPWQQIVRECGERAREAIAEARGQP